MKLLTYVKLWAAERSLTRINQELAAARDYCRDAERAYEDDRRYVIAEWGNWRSDLQEDLLDARERIEALEEERLYVLAKIAELRAQP